MSKRFDELERQAYELTPQEKANLTRILNWEVDAAANADVEQLWLEEARRRYDAFLRNELEALRGDAVMERARRRLK